MFGSCTCEACSFLKENGGGVDLGEGEIAGEGMGRVEGGETIVRI